MNEKARKKARRAELEYLLLDAWRVRTTTFDHEGFVDWLKRQSSGGAFCGWQEEAKELIALYEGE